jgi:hypothetical protein
MKTKTFFFSKFGRKPGIFNTGFVSLRYKNTNQYYTKFRNKIHGKNTNFFENFWNWARPGQKNKSGPNQLQGWTQPSCVGWADVPT